ARRDEGDSRTPGPHRVCVRRRPRPVEAAREAAAGASFTHIEGLLAGEVLVGILYALAGYVLFRLLEAFARRGGLQEAY
ncbi:MAG TPA: hypothetical protein VFD88_01990, partial [Clostridia bacterium]|nr:hypothetical protein [Clostridia bacterium]